MIQKDSPLVTIQCLTYNHEPYIRQCLEGFVMQQTDFCFEVIVHDDASTDGTANIIREYAEKYPNIIKPILERENQWSKKDGSLERILNSILIMEFFIGRYWDRVNCVEFHIPIASGSEGNRLSNTR